MNGLSAAIVVEMAPTETLQNLIDELQGIVDGDPDSDLADGVEDAVAKLQTALNELGKVPPDNQAAVGAIEGAVGDLEAAVNDGLLDSTPCGACSGRAECRRGRRLRLTT